MYYEDEKRDYEEWEEKGEHVFHSLQFIKDLIESPRKGWEDKFKEMEGEDEEELLPSHLDSEVEDILRQEEK